MSLGWLQFLAGGTINSPFENSARFVETNPDATIFLKYGFFRAIGTFVHPNTLSTYISIITPFLLILILKRQTRNNHFFAFTAFLSISAPIVTMSRWGLATLGFSIALLTLFLKKTFRLKALVTLLFNFRVLLLVVLVISIFSFTLKRVQNFTASDLSLVTRIDLTKQALYVIQKNPFLGVGGGSFTKYFSENDITKSHLSTTFLAPVHSMPLLIASEHGIPALLILMTSVYFFFNNIRCSLKKTGLSLLRAACIVSILVFIFNSLVSMRYFGDRISILSFMIIGLTVNILSSNPTAHSTYKGLLSPISKAV